MPAFSLNCVMRLSQPSRATQLNTQASSACSGTWLWLKRMLRLRIEAGGDVGCGHRADRVLQLLRFLPHRDRVHVDDAIEALVRALHLDPAHQGARDSCRGADCRSACMPERTRGLNLPAVMRLPSRLHALRRTKRRRKSPQRITPAIWIDYAHRPQGQQSAQAQGRRPDALRHAAGARGVSQQGHQDPDGRPPFRALAKHDQHEVPTQPVIDRHVLALVECPPKQDSIHPPRKRGRDRNAHVWHEAQPAER